MCVKTCAKCVCSTRGSQKREPYLLGLKLKVAVSHLMCMLGIEDGSSTRAANDLSADPSL